MLPIYNHPNSDGEAAVDAWKKSSELEDSLNGEIRPEIKKYLKEVNTAFEEVISRRI